MKAPTVAACAAIALSITSTMFAEDRKPDAERTQTLERQPAKRDEDARPAPREGERRAEARVSRGFPGAELLTEEERGKLHAAEGKANEDPSVKIAEAALRDAANAVRSARDAAIIAADPSLEPILKKLKEAREEREKAAAGARRRDEGETNRRPGIEQPRRGEAAPDGTRKEPEPRK